MRETVSHTGRMRVSDIDRPVPERDPGARPRLDGEAMRERDARIARLRRQGVSQRLIADKLGISTGAVQRAVARIRAGTLPPPERTLTSARHRSRFSR